MASLWATTPANSPLFVLPPHVSHPKAGRAVVDAPAGSPYTLLGHPVQVVDRDAGVDQGGPETKSVTRWLIK